MPLNSPGKTQTEDFDTLPREARRNSRPRDILDKKKVNTKK